jgi:predicted  nucleic acid-binding Zn-ribbon protein
VERDWEQQQKLRFGPEMTGLNQTADQHIEKRNQLRKELEALQDKENNLIKEKLPLESELTNLQKDLVEAKEQIEKLLLIEAEKMLFILQQVRVFHFMQLL